MGTTEGDPIPWEEQDDIDTALYFHRIAFPDPRQEHKNVLTVHNEIAGGNLRFPAEDLKHGLKQGSTERALHRLAILGVVQDYVLVGSNSTTEVIVTRGALLQPADDRQQCCGLHATVAAEPSQTRTIQTLHRAYLGSTCCL